LDYNFRILASSKGKCQKIFAENYDLVMGNLGFWAVSKILKNRHAYHARRRGEGQETLNNGADHREAAGGRISLGGLGPNHPMSSILGLGLQGLEDKACYLRIVNGAGTAGLGLIVQTAEALMQEALTPLPCSVI
jgi:hypothetical protein